MFFKLEDGRIINLDNIDYIAPTHPEFNLARDYPYYVSFGEGDNCINISSKDYERLSDLLFGEPLTPKLANNQMIEGERKVYIDTSIPLQLSKDEVTKSYVDNIFSAHKE